MSHGECNQGSWVGKCGLSAQITLLVSIFVSGLQGEQEPTDPDYAAEIPPSGEPFLSPFCSASAGGSSFQETKRRLLHPVVQVAHYPNMPKE